MDAEKAYWVPDFQSSSHKDAVRAVVAVMNGRATENEQILAMQHITRDVCRGRADFIDHNYSLHINGRIAVGDNLMQYPGYLKKFISLDEQARSGNNEKIF